MVIARLLFGVLLVVAILCFGLSVLTGDLRWRRRGLAIVRWTVIVLLGFFAVLIVERVTALL